MSINFTIPGNPRTLQRHRDGKYGGKYDPSKADKQAFLAQCLQHRPPKPFDFAVGLRVTAVFGENARTEVEIYEAEGYTKVPDGDNLLKFIGDALNKVFWLDDKFITEMFIRKVEDNESTEPKL